MVDFKDMPHEPTTSDISVIVCAHDSGRWDDLGKALKSLAQQTLPAPRGDRGRRPQR